MRSQPFDFAISMIASYDEHGQVQAELNVRSETVGKRWGEFDIQAWSDPRVSCSGAIRGRTHRVC
jgi:hypothetical protein